MPLNIHPLGWLPDYPDYRDQTLADLTKNKLEEQCQNQEYTSSQLLELAELIQKILPGNPEDSNNENLKERLNNFIVKNQNEIEFLNVKIENKILLYRGIRNYQVKEIQNRLKFIFTNSTGSLDESIKITIFEHLESLQYENSYFGEATHHLIMYFKEIWEIPSQNSIIDFNPNYDDHENNVYYQYSPNGTIYQILDIIYKRNKKTNDSYLKIGDYGDEVSEIKEQLENLGYFLFSKQEQNNYNKSKRFFGYKTDLVVQFFQGFNNLQADGIVGPKTKELLKKNKNIKSQKFDKVRINYLQKRLVSDFGKSEVKITGELDTETQKAINKIISSDEKSEITIESVQRLLEKIIEKAEKQHHYCVDVTLLFGDPTLKLFENNQKTSKKPALFSIQQPISQKIISRFREKLKLEKFNISYKNSNSDGINSIIINIIIYPLIQLVIKNLSDIGIHGQLDYEQAITQSIDLINIILYSYQNTSFTSKDVRNREREEQLLNSSDNVTQFLFEFARGRRESERDINLKLIYQSLSSRERKRLNFLIFIAFDQIESILCEFEKQLLEQTGQINIEIIKKVIKDYKNWFKDELKTNLNNELSNNLNNELKFSTNDDNINNNYDVFVPKQVKNQTIFRICSEKESDKLPIPLIAALEKNIKPYKDSQIPVYLCLPGFVDLSSWCSPVRDQETLNSCTACAAIALIEYFQNRSSEEYTNASALFLYKVARKLMHREGDVGSSIRETMKAMVLFGIPPEEYWPYEPSKMDEEPSGFCYSYAQNYKTIQYFRLDTPAISGSDLLAQIKMTLVAGLPSMFGLTLYSSIYEEVNQKRGYIPFPNQKDHVEGGHAVVAVGYDDSKIIGNSVGALLIRNSWGVNWGERGYGWLPYDYILKGLTSDWWSLVKAEWFKTKNFGLGANDWKYKFGGDDKPGQPGS